MPEVALGHEAELNVRVGEAEIAVSAAASMLPRRRATSTRVNSERRAPSPAKTSAASAASSASPPAAMTRTISGSTASKNPPRSATSGSAKGLVPGLSIRHSASGSRPASASPSWSGVSAAARGCSRMRVNAASCSTPPARTVSVVTKCTARPAMTARAASLAMVTVFPAPGGPTTMIGRGHDSGTGEKVKRASSARARASARASG